jgi:hypothetical protein
MIEWLEPYLRAGLAWLLDTEQPDESIIIHHGVLLRVPGEPARSLSFAPQSLGSVGTPSYGRPVIALEARGARWDGERGVWHDGLRPGELQQLADLVVRLGHPVADTWNGDGLDSGSIALGQYAHPSLIAAVDRYREGCPRHFGSVFCDRDGCDWYRTGREKIIAPGVESAIEAVRRLGAAIEAGTITPTVAADQLTAVWPGLTPMGAVVVLEQWRSDGHNPAEQATREPDRGEVSAWFRDGEQVTR